MKVVISNFGLMLRLGITATVMLFAQQAMAIGTDAGTPVNNTATVTYDVSTIAQAPIAAVAPQFLVDRRVDFSLTADGVTATVAPGATGLTFDFTLQNDGNSAMDFEITLRQMDSGDLDVNGEFDTDVDVSNVVFTAYVDNLGEDLSTVINVTGDAALALANADVANIEITATARDPSGDSGSIIALTDTSAVADNPAAIDNVLADAGNNGIELAEDGFKIESAALTITKTVTVVSDPINGVSANAKAIPGAVLEYLIVIDNSTGSVAATGISIADTVDPAVLFVNAASAGAEPYNGATANVSFTGGTFCLADAGDTNTDGCTLAGNVLTIAGSDMGTGNVPITVGIGAILEIRFQVIVPAT